MQNHLACPDQGAIVPTENEAAGHTAPPLHRPTPDQALDPSSAISSDAKRAKDSLGIIPWE